MRSTQNIEHYNALLLCHYCVVLLLDGVMPFLDTHTWPVKLNILLMAYYL